MKPFPISFFLFFVFISEAFFLTQISGAPLPNLLPPPNFGRMNPITIQTPEDLEAFIWFSDSSNPSDEIKLKSIVLSNIPLLEKMISSPVSQHAIAFEIRKTCVGYLQEGVAYGLVTKSHFMDIILSFLINRKIIFPGSQSQKLAYDLSISTLAQISGGETLFFSEPNLSQAEKDTIIKTLVEDSFLTLNDLLESLSNTGLITSKGIKNSLSKKIENTKKEFEKGQKKASAQTLQAARNEITAQRGKHITDDGADILDGYIKNLIAHIESGQP